MNFSTGLVAADNGGAARTDITVDNTIVAFLNGAQTLDSKTLTNAGSITQAGAATFTSGTGAVSLSGPTTVADAQTFTVGSASNSLTTETAASINTGNGLTSGQALAVNLGSSAFTTGAGTGFYYLPAGVGNENTLTGAANVRSTGNFSGTLLALTADQTTAGTILGISAKKLTTGKAIDVGLGSFYTGQSETVNGAGQDLGAVNIRAQAFTGNILNVSSPTAAAQNGSNLVNFSSGQLTGRLLNVNATGTYVGSGSDSVVNIAANSATTGNVATVSATASSFSGRAVTVQLGGGSAGATGYYLETAASGFQGSLIDLRANGSTQFIVDHAGTTTIAGNTFINGTTTGLQGPASAAFKIDARGTQQLQLGTGATTGAVQVSRAGQLTNVNGTLNVVESFSVNTNKLTIDASTGNLVSLGSATFGKPGTGVNTINLIGANAGSSVQIYAEGASPDIGINLNAKGTGRVGVTTSGASTGLDVSGDVVAGAAGTNRLQLVSAPGITSGVPALTAALSTAADTSLGLTPRGKGRVQVTANGLDVTACTGTCSAGNVNALSVTLPDQASGPTGVFVNTAGVTSTYTGKLIDLQANSASKFSVTEAGNTAIGGTLTATGAASLQSTLNVTGAATLSNTLAVTGAATLSNTLAVTGATTLSSTLTVTGATTLNGAATINNSLTVTGATTLTGANSLTLGTSGPSGNTGGIVFKNASNAFTVTVRSGVTSADYTLTLPTAQGAANSFLRNDGSGNLSWVVLTGGGSGGLSLWKSSDIVAQTGQGQNVPGALTELDATEGGSRMIVETADIGGQVQCHFTVRMDVGGNVVTLSIRDTVDPTNNILCTASLASGVLGNYVVKSSYVAKPAWLTGDKTIAVYMSGGNGSQDMIVKDASFTWKP